MPGTFTFKPIEAKLTHDTSYIGGMDPYCLVKMGKNTLRSDICYNGGKNPQWQDTITVDESNESKCVIEVKDKAMILPSSSIGSFELDLDHIKSHGSLSKWFPLNYNDKLAGEILVEASFTTQELNTPSQPLDQEKEEEERIERTIQPSDLQKDNQPIEKNVDSLSLSDNVQKTTIQPSDLQKDDQPIEENATSLPASDNVSKTTIKPNDLQKDDQPTEEKVNTFSIFDKPSKATFDFGNPNLTTQDSYLEWLMINNIALDIGYHSRPERQISDDPLIDTPIQDFDGKTDTLDSTPLVKANNDANLTNEEGATYEFGNNEEPKEEDGATYEFGNDEEPEVPVSSNDEPEVLNEPSPSPKVVPTGQMWGIDELVNTPILKGIQMAQSGAYNFENAANL